MQTVFFIAEYTLLIPIYVNRFNYMKQHRIQSTYIYTCVCLWVNVCKPKSVAKMKYINPPTVNMNA